MRGDLAECRTGAGRALREVLGLVIRRQVALWFDWRPWLALADRRHSDWVLLSHASRSWGEGRRRWTSCSTGRLWDFSYLANPGWRATRSATAVGTAAAWLALIGWSWTSGFVLARLSRPTVWLTVTMLCLVVVIGNMGDEHHRSSSPRPRVLAAAPHDVRRLPASPADVPGDGARRVGRASWVYRHRSLRLIPTVIGVLLLASVTLAASRGLEGSMSFGRGVVPADKGPMGSWCPTTIRVRCGFCRS